MKKSFKRRDFLKKGAVGGTVALAAATIGFPNIAKASALELDSFPV